MESFFFSFYSIVRIILPLAFPFLRVESGVCETGIQSEETNGHGLRNGRN
jgi:hypothetical protein